MKTAITTWEDEETNRNIEFAVQYKLDGESVTIHDVTPKTVTILCGTSGAVLRRMHVHTEKGRQLLTRIWRTRGGLEQTQQQLQEDQLASAS